MVSKTSISSTFSAGAASLLSLVLLEALDDVICYFLQCFTHKFKIYMSLSCDKSRDLFNFVKWMWKWMRSSLGWMRSTRSLVVRASDCQCQSRNSPGFDPSFFRHSESEGRQMEQC